MARFTDEGAPSGGLIGQSPFLFDTDGPSRLFCGFDPSPARVYGQLEDRARDEVGHHPYPRAQQPEIEKLDQDETDRQT
jgi:hypothetical protein